MVNVLPFVYDDEVDAFESWARRSRGLRPKTVGEYVRRLRMARRALPGRLADMDEIKLRAYVDTLHPSASNRNDERNAWRAFFAMQIERGHRTDNPGDGLRRWKVNRGVPNPFLAEEAAAIIKAAPEISAQCDFLVTMYFYSGLRLNELVPARWRDLKPDHIRLVQKGGDVQVQPLPGPARDKVDWWRGVCPSIRWVNPSARKHDAPISGEWAYRLIKAAGERAGVDDVHPHRMRHTYATELLRATHDLAVVQRGLRHVNAQNTVRYADVVKTAVMDGAEKIHF